MTKSDGDCRVLTHDELQHIEKLLGRGRLTPFALSTLTGIPAEVIREAFDSGQLVTPVDVIAEPLASPPALTLAPGLRIP